MDIFVINIRTQTHIHVYIDKVITRKHTHLHSNMQVK